MGPFDQKNRIRPVFLSRPGQPHTAVPGLLLLLSLVALFLMPGCRGIEELINKEAENLPHGQFLLPEAPPKPPEAGDVRLGSLYYADTRHQFLVPVQRTIPWVEGIATFTLMQLVPSPESAADLEKMGLSTVLPVQTEVIGMTISDGLARVDMNSNFLNYPPEHERLVLGSILCTLRQFSTIETVEIMVEGENIDRFPGGAPGRLPLGPECYINLEMDETVEDYRNYTAVRLYFCYATPSGRALYVPVTRILPPLPLEDIPGAAIRELLQGPRKGSGLFSDIPAGTELRRINLVDSLAKLDLSEAFLTYEGGRSGAENMVNQILLTLGSLEGIEQVQITVEGARVALEGLDLTAPLTPPEVYNYF